ncbi:3782_t:CDS:2 [Ambispora leptoticha]|uniref:3782_t:CDS:1 n=1 Tax=Ambispora leptoticha TaxID=144679 RepID=A0A9N9IP13_9GLOM|nr:3782_t:CDS:2 [Ambispora leptoticha]
MNRVCSEVGAETLYMGAWRSRTANKKRGAEEINKSYQRIKSLLDNLLTANPGSVTAFDVDRFNHAFLCLHPWIKVTEHCRSVFTFDACHSKSSYRGVFLGTSTIEGEGKLVPVAFAICSIENSNNWAWFCELLHTALPTINTNETVIISDREKGIADVVRTELPNAFHAHCVWYIEKMSIRSSELNLGALHIEDFENIMKDISKLHAEAAIYLNEIPPET